jgi:hypothetical protein
MPWARFQPKIPVFEGAKKVHALERADTVTGTPSLLYLLKKVT